MNIYEVNEWYPMSEDTSFHIRFKLNGDSTIAVRVWKLAPGDDRLIKEWLRNNMGRGVWEREPWRQNDGEEYVFANWWRS